MRRLASLLALTAALVATPARAAPPDPVDFLFRIGMMEGHLMIGRELLDANQPSLALPHYGHPVRELYDDIAPWLEANHVARFDTALVRLEAAAATAPAAPATRALHDEVIAALHAARATAPAALRESIPAMIRICADTVDAAAGEYGQAVNRGRIDSPVEYHDSRGYLAYVETQLTAMRPVTPEQTALVSGFSAVLAKARWIVAPLLPPDPPRASVTQYRAIAAEAGRAAGK